MSGHQATVLKTSSNTTIPEAWITDPAMESSVPFVVIILFCIKYMEIINKLAGIGFVLISDRTIFHLMRLNL